MPINAAAFATAQTNACRFAKACTQFQASIWHTLSTIASGL
jgi:hypothetical protein